MSLVRISHEINRQAQMTISSWSTHTMQVSFTHFWEIKIYHNVDCRNVDTSGEQIRRHQTSGVSLSEIVENFVPFVLRHFGMNVVAWVIQLNNFFGKKFHSQSGIAENDCLLDILFTKKSIETVQLLTLLDIGVEIGNTLQGQLSHEVNFVTVWNALQKFANARGVCGRE